jgi:hypothetical protein
VTLTARGARHALDGLPCHLSNTFARRAAPDAPTSKECASWLPGSACRELELMAGIMFVSRRTVVEFQSLADGRGASIVEHWGTAVVQSVVSCGESVGRGCDVRMWGWNWRGGEWVAGGPVVGMGN